MQTGVRSNKRTCRSRTVPVPDQVRRKHKFLPRAPTANVLPSLGHSCSHDVSSNRRRRKVRRRNFDLWWTRVVETGRARPSLQAHHLQYTIYERKRRRASLDGHLGIPTPLWRTNSFASLCSCRNVRVFASARRRSPAEGQRRRNAVSITAFFQCRGGSQYGGPLMLTRSFR